MPSLSAAACVGAAYLARPRMIAYLLVALGGALGSVARFAASAAIGQRVGETFPWGTIIVNVTGSFIIGFVATLTTENGRSLLGEGGRQFVMTGVLGGFTTFSSFSLQTLVLAREGEWLRAGGNVAASLGLCLAAVWLGHLAALGLNARR